MKIGIDARFLGSSSKGLGRYTEQLVRNLEILDTEHEWVIFLRKGNWDIWNPKRSNFKKVEADFRWYSLEEQTKFPKVLKAQQCDLYHFPHFNVPLRAPRPFVVTVHDLILSHYPTIKASTLGPALYWFKHKMYQLVMQRALQKSVHVITVSNFTAQDIQKTFGISKDKITVTYEGVDPLIGSHETEEEILGRYNILSPYLLYVGNAYPHKNLEKLIDAFTLLQKKDSTLSLVLVGKHDYFFTELIAYTKKQQTKNVIFPGFVPDRDLGTLYKEAKAYIFPSLYEGFGLPPLEAMMKGTPVVSSNASCLPEILGAAAEYFSPENAHDIVKVVESVLKDQHKQHEMSQKGLKRVQAFDWKKMAQETHKIYSEVYESTR